MDSTAPSPAPRPQVKDLSIKHDAIMQWLMANPQLSLGACAIQFGITPAWLSIIIHSDIFQAKYQELLKGQYDERILPLREKLIGVTAAALEKVGSKLDTCEDLELLSDIASKGLKALGYGPAKAQVNIQQNFGAGGVPQRTSVTPQELAEARELYQEHCRANAAKPKDITDAEFTEVQRDPAAGS